MLYLVPSPIGNLGDITYRAVETLKRVAVILCEDTRTSQILLNHYNIHKPLFPYHLHNEHKVLDRLVGNIGLQDHALITDAGTPGISDPGFLITRECIRSGIRVECLPGPSAVLPALIQSGLPAGAFVFEGFLPIKKGRHTLISSLSVESRTILLYESPHRLLRTLRDLAVAMGGERPAAVCRELTKIFEETRRDTLDNLSAWYTAHPPKGEIVLVISGAL